HQPIAPGDPTARGDYLAFGQVLDLTSYLGGTGVSPVPTIRYGWCGSWGYQNDALDPTGGPGLDAGGPAGAVLGDVALDLGLLHIGARYYSPDIGRWVQRDPIGVAGGINVYEYVLSEPANAVDPTGLTILDPLIEVTTHAAMRMGERQVSYSALAQAMRLANAIRIKFDEFQQLQALIFGSNGLTVVYQITGRYAGCVRTVWWQKP
ncbi:MAG: RHS repeat-associated core domain-containing protein, partial [Parvularculaceae bacterium]|nr:RHS repeat-associated core domain-containing protein [Parvularculaceae bacterium]